jgi:hypothetical protein
MLTAWCFAGSACTGDVGAQGSAGKDGVDGLSGKDGVDGKDGTNGAVGADGVQGPQGIQGVAGAAGVDATAFATLGGTITDYYGNVVAGAKVVSAVGTDSVSTTTDATGAYRLTLAAGTRTITVTADGYATYSQSVQLVPSKTTTLDLHVNPNGPAAIMAVRTDTTSPVVPGTQITLKANAFAFDPSLKTATPTYKWSVLSGPAVSFDDDTSATPKVTLASSAAFKKYLVENFATPLYKPNPDEPPVNVDRYQVLPINYDAVTSKGNTTVLKVVVTLGGRTFTAKVSVAAKLQAVPATGLQNVPINQPVVLQGQYPFKKSDGTYLFPQKAAWNWSVTGPSGVVTVNDPTTPYPDFTPTAAGKYDVSEGGAFKFSVWAGAWTGATGGAGLAKDTCTMCHASGGYAGDMFSPWMKSGHRGVIFAGIEEALPDGHYSASCTGCHTVGQGLTGASGYAEAAASDHVDYSALQGDVNAEADFWRLYPNAAKFAGIQCENCHGPNSTTQHKTSSTAPFAENARVSYSSNTCATCHARAPKHGRFPQWAKSGHASYATFTFNSNTDGSLSNSCACCHSAQGFKAYRTALKTANGDRSKTALPTDLNLSNAEPVTCVACHDTHDEGDMSKAEWSNLSTVGPTEGSTYMLPSGFAATGVGKGALCITCHNSRQGISGGAPYLHEDGDVKFGTLASYGAPHEAAQGDVLLGRNAYWLGADKYNSPTTRSKHSYVTDTCVTCHMELTTLDLTLSEAGQTRHDFKATTDVCNKCHTSYSTESIQAVFDAKLSDVKAAAGRAIMRLKYNDAIPAGTSAVLVANRSGMVDVTDATGTHRWFIGDKTGQDAFLADPNQGNALVQGCTMTGAETANCTGFLHGAPGVASISGSTQDATVATNGVNGVVAKALWNTVLVQDDASRGVHNPSFGFQVMDATIAHLSAFTK